MAKKKPQPDLTKIIKARIAMLEKRINKIEELIRDLHDSINES